MVDAAVLEVAVPALAADSDLDLARPDSVVLVLVARVRPWAKCAVPAVTVQRRAAKETRLAVTVMRRDAKKARAMILAETNLIKRPVFDTGKDLLEGTGGLVRAGVAARGVGLEQDGAGLAAQRLAIHQHLALDGMTDTDTVATADYERAKKVLEEARQKVGYQVIQGSTDVAKVSVIGIGMRSHAGVAADAFRALAGKGINIRAITTSEIKISVLIDAPYTELAVRTLHSLYGLDGN